MGRLEQRTTRDQRQRARAGNDHCLGGSESGGGTVSARPPVSWRRYGVVGGEDASSRQVVAPLPRVAGVALALTMAMLSSHVVGASASGTTLVEREVEAPAPPSPPVVNADEAVEPMVDVATTPCTDGGAYFGYDVNGTTFTCAGQWWPDEFEGGITYVDDDRYPLSVGQRGPHVAFVQTMLEALGYSVGESGADGYFGIATHTAVVKWQLASGRTVTAKVTVADMDAMRAALDGSPTAVASLHWVAMGDSYSAGVGLGSVPAGCDQDEFAYAPRARRDILSSSYTIDSFNFVACSGAVTQDVRSPSNDIWEDQLGAISASTNVVSLTVGGNDIGFADKLAGCAIGECGPDLYGLEAHVEGGSQTWDDVFDRLVTTYIAARRRMSPSGHVYVLSYPIPFARTSPAGCAGLTSTEQNAANALVTRLDDTISLAVQHANDLLQNVHNLAGNVHFVEWRTGARAEGAYTIGSIYPGAGGVFASYSSADGLCNGQGHTPFIRGYTAEGGTVQCRTCPFGNSFHPNSTGYWHAAQQLATAIRNDFPARPAPPPITTTPPPPTTGHVCTAEAVTSARNGPHPTDLSGVSVHCVGDWAMLCLPIGEGHCEAYLYWFDDTDDMNWAFGELLGDDYEFCRRYLLERWGVPEAAINVFAQLAAEAGAPPTDC